MKKQFKYAPLKLLSAAFFAVVAASLIGGAVSAKDITADYVVSGDETENLVVKSGSNVTITVNGSLTVAGNDAIYVENGATLVLNGTGTIESVGTGRASLYNNGTTTVYGVTITKDESKGSWYTILNHSSLTVNSGTIKQDNYKTSSLVDNGYYNYTKTSAGERTAYIVGTGWEHPTMVINGGTFDGGMNTIKNDDGATLTINDGTFQNMVQVAVQNNNIATINGGVFNVPSGNDKTTLANRCYAGGVNAGELTITGGEFTAEYLLQAENTPSTTIITNGVFNVKAVSNPTYSVAATTITGGEFTGEGIVVSPADGYEAYLNGDGATIVLPAGIEFEGGDYFMNLIAGKDTGYLELDEAVLNNAKISFSEWGVVINENGTIYPVTTGATVMTIEFNGKVMTIKITVSEEEIADTPAVEDNTATANTISAPNTGVGMETETSSSSIVSLAASIVAMLGALTVVRVSSKQ